jgi:hypothetical protein
MCSPAGRNMKMGAMTPRHPSSSSIAGCQSHDAVPIACPRNQKMFGEARAWAHSLAPGLQKDEWSAVVKSGCDGRRYGAGAAIPSTTEQAFAGAPSLIRPLTGKRVHSFSGPWRSTPGPMAGRHEALIKLSPSRGIVPGQASLLDLSAPLRDRVLLPEVRSP